MKHSSHFLCFCFVLLFCFLLFIIYLFYLMTEKMKLVGNKVGEDLGRVGRKEGIWKKYVL